nr:unnamed protein product [Callosobruchus analis]
MSIGKNSSPIISVISIFIAEQKTTLYFSVIDAILDLCVLR